MADKGLSYGELIVDNIIGLDNEYESFGEKLGKTVNKDEIGFLKDSAVGIYEGAKEFITNPIDTTKEVVTNIKDSVQRLGTQDLNTRLKNMYGIGYESATDDQVSAAREAVFGDALTALELIPAAKATVVAAKAGTAAIPSGVKADVVGQTKALFSGDKEFLQGTPSVRSATQSLSAGFTGSTPPTYLKRDNPFIEDRGEELSWDQVPFEIADDQLNLLNTKLLMFREPIVEFAETVAIPKKGLLGSQFLAQIKKNESIPETSLQEGIIKPSKRYTKEELLKALGKGTNTQGTFRSVANIADDRFKQFETYQRQKSVAFNGGTEQLYFDIPLDSTIGYPGKKFKANDQHYNPETLVHVRGSIINPSSYGFQRSVTFFDNLIEDEDYLLVEELQSDLLTKGYIKPKNKFDFLFNSAVENFNAISSVGYRESFGTFDKQVRDIVKELDSEGAKYPEPPKQITIKQFFEVVDEKGNILPSKENDFAKFVEQQDINQAAYEDKIDAYTENLNKKLLDKKIFNEMDAGELNIIYNGYLESKNSQFFTENTFKSDIGLPPIRKNKQAVDEALKVIIAKAAQSGVTKIVIPPADRIVAARGRELSTKEGDRFNRTYVTDLNKSLKDLEDNYPVKIERLVELPYDDAGSDVDGLNLSKEGTVIDISELVANYRVEQPRQFAQGGVAMKDQMEMSFAIGGVAETVDPVSGNDVPPGSLPEEVRDDIPARLSEGEYVVPADVVRYYGVKFFEDLRTQAKMGLQQMDADGRIGGEPMEPQQAELSDEDLNSIIEQAMQQEQPMMANEGGVVGYKHGGYHPPDFLGMSVFGDKGDKEGTPYEFYDPDVGGYKPTTGDYGTTPEAPTVTANVPDPVCPPGPNGERQRYDKSKGMCVPVSEGPTTEPEDPKPSVPFGSDFNDGQGVNWVDPADVLKFAKTFDTGMISEDVRTGAGLATAFIPGAAPLAALGVLGGKIDATKDVAGLKATRIISAALGQTENVKQIGGILEDYEKKFGDGFSGTFGIGTGLNYAASALGVDRKDVKDFIEIYDSKGKSAEEKLAAKEKLQVLIQTSSNKEKERKLAAERAAQEAARQAARQAQLEQARQNQLSNMTYRSGDDDSDSTKTYLGTTSPGSGGYSPKVYQPTAKTVRAPSRPSSVTKSSRSSPSRGESLAKEAEDRYSGGPGFRNTGGLVQKRKKKK